MSEQPESTRNVVFIDPASDFEIKALPEQDDDAAAVILAAATGAGTIEAAAQAIAEVRAIPKAALYGAYVDRDLVGAYGIQRDSMANVIALIAVREDHRRRGIERRCCRMRSPLRQAATRRRDR